MKMTDETKKQAKSYPNRLHMRKEKKNNRLCVIYEYSLRF